ncbi:MAG: sulfatase [Acidobacteriota bacterium]
MQRRAFLSALAYRPQRPNFLFLLTDDQRADLMSCAGHPVLRTPNIDRIAASGVRFVNNFCATAICCTSRATILTGLHEKSHGVSDVRTPLRPETLALSYPQRLREAGYRTGFVGKYGVGGDGAPRDHFDVSFGNPGPERVGQSRELGRQAMDFLESSSATQPFCLSVSFRAPHARDPDPKQYLYDPEEAGLYRDLNVPVPRKAAPEFFARMPEAVRSSESRARWQKRFTTPEHYQESVKSYFRLIAGVDAVVGDIVATLARRGFESNTVIVFSADNGYFLGEWGLADKWYLYEESIRTPLIIADPRSGARLRGAARREMTLNLDISPTLLSLAGLTVPASVQGRDLSPLLRGEKPRWRKDWFYSHLFGGNPPQVVIPRSEGVRGERFKYLRWIQSQPLREEVYDLARDPDELHPLERNSKLEELRGRWSRWNQALSSWSPSRPWADPR